MSRCGSIVTNAISALRAFAPSARSEAASLASVSGHVSVQCVKPKKSATTLPCCAASVHGAPLSLVSVKSGDRLGMRAAGEQRAREDERESGCSSVNFRGGESSGIVIHTPRTMMTAESENVIALPSRRVAPIADHALVVDEHEQEAEHDRQDEAVERFDVDRDLQ